MLIEQQLLDAAVGLDAVQQITRAGDGQHCLAERRRGQAEAWGQVLHCCFTLRTIGASEGAHL